MSRQEGLRNKIDFRLSPLLDMALSLIVVQNPERFGQAPPWAERITSRIDPHTLAFLFEQAELVDLFALAIELEEKGLPVPEALRELHKEQPELANALSSYWLFFAPEIAAQASRLVESMKQETSCLEKMDPLAFLSRFSDRISVSDDGESIVIRWGKGMRVPLADLTQIVMIPSAICPRRLMFYRHGPLQIFFYNPDKHAASYTDAVDVPESLTLGFAALADPTRLKILRLIAQENLPAQEMARRLELNESTVSRHLRILVEAGLAARERQEGRFIIYSFHSQRIAELMTHTESFLRGVPSQANETLTLEDRWVNAFLGI